MCATPTEALAALVVTAPLVGLAAELLRELLAPVLRRMSVLARVLLVVLPLQLDEPTVDGEFA